MAHLGCSLIGDPVYGRHRGIRASGSGAAFEEATKAARQLTRQALHAASLSFIHPVTKERLSAEAKLPEDFAAVKMALEGL